MELQVAWSDMADMMDLPYAEMHAGGGPAVGTGTGAGAGTGVGATGYNGFHARSPAEAKWQPEEPGSPRSNGDSGKHGSPPTAAGSQVGGMQGSGRDPHGRKRNTLLCLST